MTTRSREGVRDESKFGRRGRFSGTGFVRRGDPPYQVNRDKVNGELSSRDTPTRRKVSEGPSDRLIDKEVES